MSALQSELLHTLERTPADLDRLSELIDPAWIAEALRATGTASIRRRKLPAEHVVWLVIGLALFRNQPIWHVVRQLDLVLGGQPMPVPSATVQGRQRLGEAPLKALFRQLANAWTRSIESPDTVQGLRVPAVDGVVWSAPDTPDNRQALGDCRNQHGPGGWPQIRAVCLMDTDSHELMDARLGGMSQGELTLAADLQPCDRSLTLFHRAYFSAALLLGWQGGGEHRHWLMRAKTPLRHEVMATLGEGDWLIRMPVSPQARRRDPRLPEHWQARLIEVACAGRPRRLLTSLADPDRYPAAMLAALYRQRWEIELGLREIKQSLQAGAILRSRQPALVPQALWGVLIAYTLLRRMMRRMAEHVRVPPLRIGFHVAAIALQAIGRCKANLDRVERVLADGGYVGQPFADAVQAAIGADVQIARRSELHTFAVMPQRWVVERSFAWLEKCRRLWKNYEHKLNTGLQFIHLAFLTLLLRRS